MGKLTQSAADDRLLAAIDSAESTAYGSESDSELARSRELSILRYLGRNFNPAPEGRSQVRDRSTFEVIEWTKPSLLRIFCSADEIVKFEPQGPEDEKQSQQESDYINYVVTQRNPWTQVCHDWFTDALVLKNGYVYAYWHDAQQVESEYYRGISDDQAALILEDQALEVVGHDQRPDEETDKANAAAYQQFMQQYQMQVQQAMASGAQPGQLPPPPEPPQLAFLHDIEIKRVRERGQVCIETLAPERCKIDVNTKSFTLDDCMYFESWDYKTISQLRADGLDVPEDIAFDDIERTNPEEIARDLYSEQTNAQAAYDTPEDTSMRTVRLRRIWIRHDYDGDGIAELQYVLRVGGSILHREECVDIPVASISPIPLPHRHIGMSLADTVADIEDINTNITRGAIDNLNLSNTPRMAASDRVNMNDLLDVRVGGVIRIDGQPPQELMPVVVPDVFPSAVNALSFFDSRRQNRTGINAYFQGTDANVLNKTASGIQQLTSSAAQRVEMIARLFAFGVERLFRIVHRLTLQNGRKAETIKLRNQWVTVNPSEWRRRTDLRVVVGLGTGSKEGQLAALNNIYALQMQGLPLGTATPDNVYKTSVEMAKAASFPNAESFFNDPKGKTPQQPPDPVMEKAKIDAQVKAQTSQLEAQHAAQMEQMRQQFEAQVLQQKQAFDQWKVQFEAGLAIQLEEMKADTQKETATLSAHTTMRTKEADMSLRQIEMDREDAKGAEEKQGETEIASTLLAITQAVNDLKSIQNTPKEIVRDANGRVIGVRPAQTQ